MMRTFLLFCAFLLTINANVNANVNDRRGKILSIIDDELKEVTRLSRTMGSRNPELLLRMAELYLEKARLIRDHENKEYLILPPEKRQRVRKKVFFKESYGYFIKAQKTCYFLLKNFKRFKGKSRVYYILAYNAKEFQKHKQALTYYKKATQNSKRHSRTHHLSKLALAEMLFNKKDFAKAYTLYHQSLTVIKDRWWTKNAFDMAWCAFKIGKRKKAINLMHDIYKKSKSPNYIDMSNLVERDIGYFYVASNRLAGAKNFYKSIGKDTSGHFIKIAKSLKGQGKFTDSEKMFQTALDLTKNEKSVIEIKTELLSLYDRFGKTSDHLKTCQYLVSQHQKGNLTGPQLEIVKYHINRFSAILQKQIAGKTYAKLRTLRKKKAAYAADYFALQGTLNKGSRYKSVFLAAEAYYAGTDYNRAIPLYDTSFKGARRAKDKKLVNLSLEGMLACLGQKGLSKKLKNEYLDTVYQAYLIQYPKGKKSFAIYQRLFSKEMELKKVENAERTLMAFTKNFPKAYVKQEAMLAKLMDHYRKIKNISGIKKFVALIKKGQLKVSRKYAKNLNAYLLTVQFEGVEKASSKGQKKAALVGYLQIYKSSDTSAIAKKNAAYNIAVLLHELGDMDKTFRWLERAIKLMNKQDIKKFKSSFILMGNSLFESRKFKEASVYYEGLLTKLCHTKLKEKSILFKNAYIIYLADRRPDNVISLINQGKQCGISMAEISTARLELIKFLAEGKRYTTLEEQVAIAGNYRPSRSELIIYLDILRKAYAATGRIENANQMTSKIHSYYRYCVKKGYAIPLESLDIIADKKLESLERMALSIRNEKFRFPENSFNKILKRKFGILEKVTNKSLEVLKIGSGKGIIFSYNRLIFTYESLIQQVSEFRPQGKSAEYIKSFQASMSGIIKPLKGKVSEFKREARNHILRSNILTDENYKFLSRNPLPLDLKFFTKNRGIIMDRGGLR